MPKQTMQGIIRPQMKLTSLQIVSDPLGHKRALLKLL